MNRMNLLKSGKKQSRKEVLAEEATVGLPDVVAGLSLGDPYGSGDYPNGTANADQMDDSMMEYSSHFTPISETTAFRRIPQGLAAGPMTPEGHLEHSGNQFDPGGFLKRLEPTSLWRPTHSETQWEQSQIVCPSPMGPPLTEVRVPLTGSSPRWQGRVELVSTTHSSDLESNRIRSVSSEPRGPHRDRNEDRRARCSSATRNRQSRHRTHNCANHTLPHSTSAFTPPTVSPPMSPPLSPPMHRVQYQSIATSTTPTLSPHIIYGDTRQREGQRPLASGPIPTAGLGGPGGSYGYHVRDLDALLSQASRSSPANLPMVLNAPTTLLNMRMTPGSQSQAQSDARSYLPLGIIVNAVFKTRNWLYVRTAHGAEGYVPYAACLPLGILPVNRASLQREAALAATGLAWESPTNSTLTGPHRPRASTAKAHGGYSNTTETTHRSRPRARRRHVFSPAELANQTDSQKLQPDTPNHAESRDLRENFESVSFSPHIV